MRKLVYFTMVLMMMMFAGCAAERERATDAPVTPSLNVETPAPTMETTVAPETKESEAVVLDLHTLSPDPYAMFGDVKFGFYKLSDKEGVWSYMVDGEACTEEMFSAFKEECRQLGWVDVTTDAFDMYFANLEAMGVSYRLELVFYNTDDPSISCGVRVAKEG